MKKIVTIIAFATLCLYSQNGDVSPESNASNVTHTQEAQKNIEKQELIKEKNKLDEDINENNIWLKIYSNYRTYEKLIAQNELLDKEIKRLENLKSLTQKQEKQLQDLQNEQRTVSGKLQLLKEYEKDPFEKILKHNNIEETPSVGNPIAILNAISYQKTLNSDHKEYQERYDSLQQMVNQIKEEKVVLQRIIELDESNQSLVAYQNQLSNLDRKLVTFEELLEIFKTTKNVYEKKIEEINLKLNSEIKREIQKTLTLLMAIFFFVIVLVILKLLTRRYMLDDDRAYRINKALNMLFFTVLILVLLFSYIENVSYLVTVLSFASAGIAIAMKDWFMNMLGWIVLVTSDSIRIGDRVRFDRNGVVYVGDIVDISLLRMTMQEDVTLVTYTTNRRAGRFVFIPNNYIFTEMISNYSHAGLKTVWDGIDFIITFDSDEKRAMSIAKEVTKKYSKGYTEITRKQLNALRSEYSLKNTNVEPRIFAFFDTYGIKISSWYLTNSFATLKLRSTISMEIMEQIKKEPNISLAYPAQSLFIDKHVRQAGYKPLDSNQPPKASADE
ncbi:MAG: membrane protein [Sulfurovum sp. PC08-66]|jgi:small-conductance mechanosensitive channel|nr:MAG: membrane protein [Sulfurovum sp. PC08-66]